MSRAVVIAVLACALGAACAAFGLSGPVAPQLAVYECQLGVLSDAVPVPVAEDLVMAARAGNVQYVARQLLALGLTPERIGALADAFNACTPSGPSEGPALLGT